MDADRPRRRHVERQATVAPEVDRQAAGVLAGENPLHVERHPTAESAQVRIEVEARQQAPIDLLPSPVREGRQASVDQRLHEAVELAGRKLRQRGHVDRLGRRRERRKRRVDGAADADNRRLGPDLLRQAPEVRLEHRHRRQQGFVGQIGEAAERRDFAEAPDLVRPVPGEGDVREVRHAAHPLARGSRLQREALRLGVEHERRHHRLREPAPVDRMARRYGPVGEHDVDASVREQRLDRGPRAVQRPVGHAPGGRGKDDPEPRGGQCRDLFLEPGPQLVVALPRSVEHHADGARIAAHLRARRLRGCRRQQHGCQQHAGQTQGRPRDAGPRAGRTQGRSRDAGPRGAGDPAALTSSHHVSSS